jgi:hypothetical protein
MTIDRRIISTTESAVMRTVISGRAVAEPHRGRVGSAVVLWRTGTKGFVA